MWGDLVNNVLTHEFLTFNSADPEQNILQSNIVTNSNLLRRVVDMTIPTDWNNDGLVDLITPVDTINSYDVPELLINDGNFNFSKASTTLDTVTYSPYRNYRNNAFYSNTYKAIDLNGDGVVDLGQSYTSDTNNNSQHSTNFVMRKISDDIAIGSASIPFAYARYKSGNIKPFGVWFMDINHDGMVDAVMNRGTHTNQEKYYINQGQIPDLMNSVTTEEGAVMTPDYKRTTQLVDESGDLQNPDLYTPLMVVDSVAIDNGLGDVQQIEYDYYGGVFTYESLEKKKLAGFEKIEKTHVGKEQVITTYYHQGNGNNSKYKEQGDSFEKIGKPYRVSTSDADKNVVHDIFNTWTIGTREDGSKYVYLSQTVSRDYTIGKSEYIDKAQSYEYNNIHGGITKHTEWGQVSYNRNTNIITDTSDDKRYTKTGYASGTNIFLPNEQELFDKQDNIQSHVKNYYDNQVFGLVTTGNSTTESRWLDTNNSWVDTQYSHNSLGLPLTITDARLSTTTNVYDTDSMFTLSVSNDLNQTTTYEYDFISGQISKSTDPSGVVSENIFDGFGRVIERKQSTPSGGLMIVEENAYDDVSMPRSVTTQQYFTSTPKYSYTYIDGLGRTLQSKQSTSNGDYQTNSYVYGATGILTLETQPYVSSNTNYNATIPSGVLSTIYGYDPRDRVVEKSKPSGSEEYKYHQWGKTTINPNGYYKKEIYDAFGNLIEVQEDIDTILSSVGVSNATTTPYEFKRQITIQGEAGAGEDYQVLVKIGRDANVSGADLHLNNYAYHFPQTRNDGGDLVFYNSDEDEMLPFWVEKVENNVAWIWIKVSDDLSFNQDIFVYYGHDTPVNYSDGEGTFIFFDEFETSVVDTTKWQNNDNGGTLQINDGKLHLNNANDGASWQTKYQFGPDTSVKWEGTQQEARQVDTWFGYSPARFYSDEDNNPKGMSSAGVFDPRFDFVKENHVFEINRHSNNKTVYSVDEVPRNQSGGSGLSSSYFYVSEHEDNEGIGGDSNIDWILVRKSNDTEPVFLTSGPEQGLAYVTQNYSRLAQLSSTDIDMGTPADLEEVIIEIQEDFNESDFEQVQNSTSSSDSETEDDAVIDLIVSTTTIEDNESEESDGNLIVTGESTEDNTTSSSTIIATSTNPEIESEIASSSSVETSTTTPSSDIVTTKDAPTSSVDVIATSTQVDIEKLSTSTVIDSNVDQEVSTGTTEIIELREYKGVPSVKPAKGYRFKELNYSLLGRISKTETQALEIKNRLLKQTQTVVNIDSRLTKIKKRISELEATKGKRENKGRDISDQKEQIKKLEKSINEINERKDTVKNKVVNLQASHDGLLIQVKKQKEEQDIKKEKKEESLFKTTVEVVKDFFSIPTADASVWANSLYDYKKAVTVGEEEGVGNNHPLLVKIGLDEDTIDADFHLDGLAEHFPLNSDDGGDLIFYNNDESATMPFWVEKVENNIAYVWIKITDDLSQDQTMNVYFGNTTPVDYSNMMDVFPFVDDFSTSLNISIWDIDDVSIVGGRAVFNDTNNNDSKLTSIQSFGPGHRLVSKSKMVQQTYSNTVKYEFFGFDTPVGFNWSKYSNPFDLNTDYVVSTEWSGNGNFTNYIDGEYYLSSTNQSSEPVRIRQWNPYTNGTFEIDWIFVAPYIENEPTINFVEQISFRVPQTIGGITPTSVVGVTQYQYDTLDQLIKIIDAEDNEREFEYDSLGRQTSSELPHTSTSTAAVHAYTYDTAGNKTNETRPDGSVINYTYDDLNRVLTVDNPNKGTGSEVIYSYDSSTNGVGKLAGVLGDGYVKTYQYDNAGNLITESVNAGGTVHTTAMSYSDYGLLESTTNPDASVVSNSYYLTGDISGVDKDSTDVVDIDYNHIGQIISQEYENGIDQSYTYNPLWDYRLENKQTTNSSSTVLEDLNYYYDRTGNISAITDAGAEQLSLKTYDYDSVDRLISAGFTASSSVADINQLNTDITTAMSDYEQDVIDRNNLLQQTQTIYTEDISTSSSLFGPSLTESGKSDNSGATFSYFSGGSDQVYAGKYKTYRIYRTIHDFDQTIPQNNNVTSAKLVIDNFTVSARNGYTYFYVQVFAQAPGNYQSGIPVSNKIYPVNETVVEFDLDVSYIEQELKNGTLELVVRQQADIDNTYPGSRYQYFKYYNADVSLNIDTEIDNSTTETTWVYRPKDLPIPTYPDVAQIVSDFASTSSTTLDMDTYTYSETGNILTHNADAYGYADGTFPQAATSFAGKTYTYDDNGNLSSKDDGSIVSTYTYDWNDRLSNVKNDGTTIADYAYTDARQRLSKTVGTSTKYYINNNIEYDGDYTSHVFAGVNRVLTSDTDGLHYTHKDHLQSTSLTTDQFGIVEEAVDYKAFGSERNRSGTHESDYTYTDQERDTETGLMYYDARYYSPELKRFTSVDPWFGDISSPQSLNKYSYVINNPLRYTDPTGEQYFEIQGEAEFSKRWGGNVSISTLYGLTGKTQVRNLSVGGEITPPRKKSLIKRIFGPLSGSATIRLAERPTEVGEVMYGSDADWSLGPFTGSFAVGASDNSDFAFEPAFGVSTDFGHAGLQGSTGVVTGVTSWQGNIDNAVFGTAEAYSNLQSAVVNRVKELLSKNKDDD